MSKATNCIVYSIPKRFEGKKIREYLRGELDLSTRLIRGAAKDGRIRINNMIVRLDYILKYDDKVSIELNKDENQNVEPELMDIKVVFENEDILVVNKPPYIVVHPTRSHPNGTLANGILNYFRENGESCIVRLVSRLDMNTSGLIIIAKNQFSHMTLAKVMKSSDFEKSYLAVVHGNLIEEKGTIDLPIYRTDDDTVKRVVDDRGQRSITHYEVVERLREADLVKLTLETGRTHQIRVHMSHIGNPIFGDILYGTEDNEYIGRQALHANILKFSNPRDSEKINLQVDLPKDMEELLDKLRL